MSGVQCPVSSIRCPVSSVQCPVRNVMTACEEGRACLFKRRVRFIPASHLPALEDRNGRRRSPRDRTQKRPRSVGGSRDVGSAEHQSDVVRGQADSPIADQRTAVTSTLPSGGSCSGSTHAFAPETSRTDAADLNHEQRTNTNKQTSGQTQNAQTTNMRTSDSARSRVHLLAAQLRRKRRESANYRERRRMRRMNAAFDELRQRLPHSATFPLSKHETLQMAVEYIMALRDLLM